MKKGDIVQSKKHKDQLGVCTTNEMDSGFIGVLHYSKHGHEARLLSRKERWNIVEFADGRINEALFPKNEAAEEQRFEEEFYQPEVGRPVRAGDIEINDDRMMEYAVARLPRWVGNPFAHRERLYEAGDPVDF